MHFYLRFAGVQGNTGVLGSDRDLYCSGYALLFIVCWCAGKHGGVGIRQRPLLFRICTFIYGLLVCSAIGIRQ
jgi:hypothetical protein